MKPQTLPTQPNRRAALLGLAAATLGLGNQAANAAPRAAAWSIETLHAFAPNEGTRAVGSLVFGPDGLLYGVHAMGGQRGLGTVYRLSPGDGAFGVLHHFDYASEDAAEPECGLVVGQDGRLWGSSLFGGAFFRGTVYSIDTAGDVVVQAEFGAVDAGFNPMGSLVEGKAGRFYGTTGGTVYRLDARPGGQLKAIHRFDPEGDGWGSEAALTLSPQGLLYGTNGRGGTHGHGTLFRLATNGQGFENLKSLDGNLEGSDPGVPLLRASDGHFYGCAHTGGLHNKGVLFRLGSDSSYTVLHHFRGGHDDGAYPRAALVQGPEAALYSTRPSKADGAAELRHRVQAEPARHAQADPSLQRRRSGGRHAGGRPHLGPRRPLVWHRPERRRARLRHGLPAGAAGLTVAQVVPSASASVA